MAAVIEVEGLRKEYRGPRRRMVRALQGLDLSVPSGSVFGFLGPNGSGKTTTIRCLLGLARPSGGSCRLLGRAVPKGLPAVVHRVGALVDTPGLNPGLSGLQTLRVLARLAGAESHRAATVLAQVGLAERSDEAVRVYSLGMRQRLAIAVALLKDPEVLVLDEPANGLDPAGMREIRELVRRLGDEGRTVFLSSHLLGEVQQVCDRVAIVARGRTLASGRVEEVVATGRSAVVLVRVAAPDAGISALRAAGLDAMLDGAGMIRVQVPDEGPEAVARALARRDVYPTELRPEDASLEDVFLRLTSDEGAEK